MFRILLPLALCVMSTLCCQADEAEASKRDTLPSRTYYMELVGEVNNATGAQLVTLNMGKMLTTRVGLTAEELKQASRAEHFTSMSDAMNALATYGWQLEGTYTLTVRATSSVHWIVSKKVHHARELLEGFMPKQQTK